MYIGVTIGSCSENLSGWRQYFIRLIWTYALPYGLWKSALCPLCLLVTQHQTVWFILLLLIDSVSSWSRSRVDHFKLVRLILTGLEKCSRFTVSQSWLENFDLIAPLILVWIAGTRWAVSEIARLFRALHSSDHISYRFMVQREPPLISLF